MESSVPGIYVAGDTAGVERKLALQWMNCRLAGVSISHSMGYISDDDALQEKENIRKRLFALCSGSFGEMRRTAKNRISNVEVK